MELRGQIFRLAWPLAAWLGIGLILPACILSKVRQGDAAYSRVEKTARQVVDASDLIAYSDPHIPEGPALNAAIVLDIPSPSLTSDEYVPAANIAHTGPI